MFSSFKYKARRGDDLILGVSGSGMIVPEPILKLPTLLFPTSRIIADQYASSSATEECDLSQYS